jgi:putative SOS response-associated peptidase YedK
MLGPMCTRYVTPEQEAAEREFAPQQVWWKFSRSFNVAPARCVPAVRWHDGESEGVMLRWGLIPPWAEGDSRKADQAHAESSLVQTSNVLSGAWLNGQRCILPVSGYYAWKMTAAGYRQPYYVQVASCAVFGVAAVWDRSVTDDDDVIEGCTLLTVPPNALLAEVLGSTTPMPAILRREDYEAWLRGTPGRTRELLGTYPREQMLIHAVSPRINSLRNDDERLAQPVGPSLPQPGGAAHAARIAVLRAQDRRVDPVREHVLSQ